MSAETCIALFVKTPGLSPVKTRLAAQIGIERAEHFHLLAAQAVASVCQQLEDQAVETYFAVAETNCAAAIPVWARLPIIFQPEGELGQRMWHIHSLLAERYRNVFLLGADVPQIRANQLSEMINWIADKQDAHLAIAPSQDGGFWCVGSNFVLPQQVWNSVTYSAATTLAEFISNANSHAAIKKFACLTDVDEQSDLITVKQALAQLASPTQEQALLLDTLNEWFI